MPKFYFVQYSDETWCFIWSFRKLKPIDICSTCTLVQKLSFFEIIDCWKSGRPELIW